MNQTEVIGNKKKWDISGILNYSVYIMVFAFIVFVGFQNKNFFTISNFLLMLQQSSPYLIAATGMAFVMMAGSIDISLGQNMLFSATIGFQAAQILVKSGMEPNTGLLLVLASVAALIAGGIVGLVNGISIAKFNIIPFIATLATSNIIRGLALIIADGQSVNWDGLSRVTNLQIGGVFPMVLIPTIVVLVITNFIARSLPFGRKVLAIGNNADNAHKVGIKVIKNKIIVQTMGGAAGGVCGLLTAAQMGFVGQNHGSGMEYVIISGCILGGISLRGGRGSIIPGAVVGVLLVQMIVNGLTMINANPFIYTIVRGVIIFLAVMIESIKYKGVLK